MKVARTFWHIHCQFGWTAAFAWVVDRLAVKIVHLELNRLFWLEVEQLGQMPAAPDDLECRFLSAQEIRAFAQEPANDLSADMAERIERGRDFCFAVLDHGKLATYCWFAVETIEAEHNGGAALSLPPDVSYVYKAYTLPAFRGQRLDGMAKSLAFRALAERGIRKLVATVQWTNWPSLRSMRRMGFAELGFMYVIGPRRWSWRHYPKKAVLKGIKFQI